MKYATQADFDAVVLDTPGITVADFYADWCGPCRMLAPVLEEVDAAAEGKFQVVKVNTDENRDLAVKYNVMTIPSLIYFVNGVEAFRSAGFTSKQAILTKVDELKN